MSRIGNMVIDVPSGTKVALTDGVFSAEGPKGKMEHAIFDGYSVEIDGSTVKVSRPGDSGPEKAKHGLLRALLANAVHGASVGFSKVLEIHGVGYRAELKGSDIHFSLGYSHPVVYSVPKGVEVGVDERAGRITLSGADRQQVGQVAAEIRQLRKPDPYKGKGIKYAHEVIRRKVGKAGVR